jgi:hypothetical protein
MTAYVEPFKSVHDALITRLEAQDLDVYDYHPLSRLPLVPAVYMQVENLEISHMRADQGELELGTLGLNLYYYTRLNKNSREAHASLYAGIVQIVAACNDASLSNEVASIDLTDISVDPVQVDGEKSALLLATFRTQVKPAHYSVA